MEILHKLVRFVTQLDRVACPRQLCNSLLFLIELFKFCRGRNAGTLCQKPSYTVIGPMIIQSRSLDVQFIRLLLANTLYHGHINGNP